MKVLLNGTEHEVAAGTTVLALLEGSGVDRRRCAVEVNLEVVPKSGHGERVLAPGDRVEVVHLVGGG